MDKKLPLYILKKKLLHRQFRCSLGLKPIRFQKPYRFARLGQSSAFLHRNLSCASRRIPTVILNCYRHRYSMIELSATHRRRRNIRHRRRAGAGVGGSRCIEYIGSSFMQIESLIFFLHKNRLFMFVRRHIESRILELCQKFPIISVIRPRQSGKTTLLRELFPKYTYGCPIV
ncbi:MAG: hypothetical protein SH848_21250 [Saprospiraceae bacterium]|nr:hypothetical protein [Saprospiraceae bacterium]MDZ4706470.1 hypothetical protein [Saprospiraceae bacterium]